MTVLTLGTNSTTSLSGLNFLRQQITTQGIAGTAQINANIKNDLNNGPNGFGSIWPGAFRMGLLQVPNRGVLQVFPGDWVVYDSTGWPILVSANAIANGPWTHS